jgi:hypothetical protein
MLKDGKIGLAALQESGETTCNFDETWIWVSDE